MDTGWTSGHTSEHAGLRALVEYDQMGNEVLYNPVVDDNCCMVSGGGSVRYRSPTRLVSAASYKHRYVAHLCSRR